MNLTKPVKPNIKLLKRLSLFLREELPAKKFNMKCWMEAKNHKKKAFEILDDNFVEPIHCKTIGCALGWAATLPEFKRKGLKFYSETNKTNSADVILVRKGIRYDNFSAASQVFGIDFIDAVALFSPSQYPEDKVTKIMVADKIDQLIESYKKRK